MADVPVINASPLIFLTRGGHTDLLLHLAPRILVPQAVADEICANGLEDCNRAFHQGH